MLSRASQSRLVAAVACAAAGLGGAVAFRYHLLGLTLSHYDARGHLVVARRIADSLTPGWQQLGAVWLPLPHLLNAIPVQLDWCYRTGGSAVAISILAFALATASLAWIVAKVTGSLVAAGLTAVVFALNPNVLYLQATPMTEPLLLGLTIAGVALLIDWCEPHTAQGTTPARASASAVGWMFALACLTRYEAWPVTATALAAAVWVRRERAESWREAAADVARIGLYPAAAILAFCLFSRVVVGQWFVSGGFFTPENVALGRPRLAADQIAWGVRAISGYGLTALGAAGLAAAAAVGLAQARRRHLMIPIALAASAALPWTAFIEGHPYRIRYMVPLIAAEAVGAGFVAGLSKRFRIVTAALVLAAAAWELRPLDITAPMVVEAQWDQPNIARRRPMSDYLRAEYHGETVMASMGSLGHYMQELSGSGLRLKDFLHEGNGDIWLNALENPRPFAGWILIDERDEGGDMLAAIVRRHPSFLDGFVRVGEGAGVALYRRDEEIAERPAGPALSPVVRF